MGKVNVLLVSLLMLISAVVVLAQTPTGNINGKITDPNGASVAGATVKITETATNREIATRYHEGFYEARNLPRHYTVESPEGFSAANRERCRTDSPCRDH